MSQFRLPWNKEGSKMERQRWNKERTYLSISIVILLCSYSNQGNGKRRECRGKRNWENCVGEEKEKKWKERNKLLFFCNNIQHHQRPSLHNEQSGKDTLHQIPRLRVPFSLRKPGLLCGERWQWRWRMEDQYNARRRSDNRMPNRATPESWRRRHTTFTIRRNTNEKNVQEYKSLKDKKSRKPAYPALIGAR